MNEPGYALFETAIGRCGIAWADGKIVGTQLPEASDAQTRARLSRRFPGAVEAPIPAGLNDVVTRITALIAGAPVELTDIELDLTGVPDFNRRVYEIARAIPRGQTLTYGDVANRLGAPLEAREVGRALGQNPFAIIVPCHRVVAANGRPGGFSAEGGVLTKMRILAIEGAAAAAQGDLFG